MNVGRIIQKWNYNEPIAAVILHRIFPAKISFQIALEERKFLPLRFKQNEEPQQCFRVEEHHLCAGIIVPSDDPLLGVPTFHHHFSLNSSFRDRVVYNVQFQTRMRIQISCFASVRNLSDCCKKSFAFKSANVHRILKSTSIKILLTLR